MLVFRLQLAELRGNERYQDALVFPLVQHTPERKVRDSKYVGFGVLPLPVLVHGNIFVAVDGQRAIRVYRDQEQSRVSLYAHADTHTISSRAKCHGWRVFGARRTYIRSASYRR